MSSYILSCVLQLLLFLVHNINVVYESFPTRILISLKKFSKALGKTCREFIELLLKILYRNLKSQFDKSLGFL